MSIFNYIFDAFGAPQQTRETDYSSSPLAKTFSAEKCSKNGVLYYFNGSVKCVPMDTSPGNSSPEATSPDQIYRGVSSSDTESLGSSLSSMDEIISQKYKKPRVTINNCVNVILIPTRGEYYCVGLSGDIWWSREELHEVKINCQEEILTYVANNSSMAIKDVMRQLYQP